MDLPVHCAPQIHRPGRGRAQCVAFRAWHWDCLKTAFERFGVATGSGGPDLKAASGRQLQANGGRAAATEGTAEVSMETDQILKAAREIVDTIKTALAITVDPAGIAQARGVWTSPLEPDWTLRFCTRRRT